MQQSDYGLVLTIHDYMHLPHAPAWLKAVRVLLWYADPVPSS